ncbi:MAG: hypothetical protein ABSA02_04410 [Trebonia sp.]
MPLTTFDSGELETFTRTFENLFNDGEPGIAVDISTPLPAN